MGRDVDQRFEGAVDASIDDAWDAISTGPGISSWFMGRTEVAGETVRTMFADCAITAAEPGTRFAYASPAAPDGRVIAFDFLLEADAGGVTSIRMVASGFLPGDDWQDEYVAMGFGHALFFRTLIEYLTFFPRRTATPVSAATATVTDWPATWSAVRAALGLTATPQVGDRATVRSVEGTVYQVSEQTLGVRTSGALYRFVQGLDGPLYAMHHVFDGTDTRTEWAGWMKRLTTS
jgi:uncharacterized protein YndB with AHSA1/START domain